MSVGSAAVLVAATLAVVAPATSSAAQRVGTTYTVLVGHDIAAGSRHHPADLMRFLPGSISVHRGDKLTFKGDFHTATALPTRIHRPGAWIRTHARKFGQRYFFIANDDEQNTATFNPHVLYPNCNVGRGCGYDGSHLVNSGMLGIIAPQVTFRVNVPAGHSFWVICLVHPQMKLHVHVVPRSMAVRSQAQINAAVRSQVQNQSARAGRLWRSLQQQHSRNGVVQAFAGFDARGLELFGMFPHTINLRHGQAVKWHFADLRYEPHSVVFPAPLADTIATGPPPMCEKNDGSGDVPATQQFTCPAGSHGPVEIELDPRLLKGSGSHTVTMSDRVHNSGARGGFDIPNDRPYRLTFPMASPTGGFRYACGVHGLMMSGRVIVH
jgi:plastocyanin